MPPGAGRIELKPIAAVVADTPSPQGVVEIDDDELTVRRRGAGHRVGERAKQCRDAVGVTRQLCGVVKAVVEPSGRAGRSDQRLEIEESDAWRGQRGAQAAGDGAPPR